MLAGGLALGMSPIVVSFVLGTIFSLLLLLFSYQLAADSGKLIRSPR